MPAACKVPYNTRFYQLTLLFQTNRTDIGNLSLTLHKQSTLAPLLDPTGAVKGDFNNQDPLWLPTVVSHWIYNKATYLNCKLRGAAMILCPFV